MGIYPAIDVPLSVSRVMNDIADGVQIEAAQKFRRLKSLYLENRDPILMGGYTPGRSGSRPCCRYLAAVDGTDPAEWH